MPNLRRRSRRARPCRRSSSVRPARVPACHGQRLKPQSLAVQVKGRTIADYVNLPIAEALRACSTALELTERESDDRRARCCGRFRSACAFCTTSASATSRSTAARATLSGGEGQRIRLATQIGANLTGVLYVLDEPSIGLHQRDNRKLLGDAVAPARSRQHRHRRRARRGDDPRPPITSSTSGPAPASTAAHVIFQGTPRADGAIRTPASLTGAVSHRRRARLPTPADAPAGAARASSSSAARAPTT